MIGAQYRESFTVYVLDGELARGRMVTEDVSNSGYRAHHILSFSSMAEQLAQNPPHILLVQYADPQFAGSFDRVLKTIQDILQKLPEAHVIILCPEEDLEEACELYEHGVYDIIEFPVFPAQQILKSLDRAATTDYYVYLNEKLREESNGADTSTLELLELFSEKMVTCESESEAVKLTLAEVSRHLNRGQMVFFRYIRGRSTLVAEAAHGISAEAIANIGIELKRTEPKFHEKQLHRPERLVGLVDLVRNGFMQRQFAAFPVIQDGSTEGVFLLLLGDSDATFLQSDVYSRLCVRILGGTLSRISLRRRIQRYSIVDEVSEALNREFFLKKLREEITRARRINRSVALLIIQVDQIRDMQLQLDPGEVERLHKAFVSIVLKNSRTTDYVGRLGEDQYGIILAHTGRKGSAIKAERLRRIIENADFKKVAPVSTNLTISVGVSEYPGTCNDASDLLRTADEALCEVIKVAKNRVCVATPKPNFTPDFQAEDGL